MARTPTRTRRRKRAPRKAKPRTRNELYIDIARWTLTGALLFFLACRLMSRTPAVVLPKTPLESLEAGHPLPREIAERLNAVEWKNRADGRLGLWVSVHWQRIFGIEGGVVKFIYPCSTAARGVGNRENSKQTPLGWHEIVERIGDGLPEGAVFNERRYTGRVWNPGEKTEKDYVLSRILWLRGMEPGVNAGPGIDSHDRYIYIHGTPAEERIGRPASLGCIRMLNRDVVELFPQAPLGTPVLITEW